MLPYSGLYQCLSCAPQSVNYFPSPTQEIGTIGHYEVRDYLDATQLGKTLQLANQKQSFLLPGLVETIVFNTKFAGSNLLSPQISLKFSL